MKEIRSILIVLVGLLISLATSIAVCIKGWGLEPKSWLWIIGVYLIGQILAQVFVLIGKNDDGE